MIDPDNREAWLTVISDLTTEVAALREENEEMRRALNARSEDGCRLSWLSGVSQRFYRSGVRLEYAPDREDGCAFAPGHRVCFGSKTGAAGGTLRQAIDAAMAESGT